MTTAGRDALVAMLSRLKNDLQGLNLNRPDACKSLLQAKYPLGGDYLVEVRRLCQRGVEAGWLLASDANGFRFSALAKPAKHFPFSIDAVHLVGLGRGHAHPKGEVNLCWGVSGKPKFCGQEPGWVVLPPGSRHVPTVTGGAVFLLYFLPNGEVAWDAASAPSAAKERTRSSVAVRPSGAVAVTRDAARAPAVRRRAGARG